MIEFLRNTRERIGVLLLIVVIILSVTGIVQIPESVYTLVGEHTYMGGVILAALMFGATVVAPITLLPAIPMIAPVLGPFITAIACWFGWTMGALFAFWIARHGGRPLIAKLVSLQKLERFENRIPKDAHFGIVFALRLVFPVDLLSYGLGLFSTVSMRTYGLASALGILWFSFAFSYLGYASFTQNTVLFASYGVASFIIFFSALWYVWRSLRK